MRTKRNPPSDVVAKCLRQKNLQKEGFGPRLFQFILRETKKGPLLLELKSLSVKQRELELIVDTKNGNRTDDSYEKNKRRERKECRLRSFWEVILDKCFHSMFLPHHLVLVCQHLALVLYPLCHPPEP
jgi:hypothetical protein